MKHNKKTLSVLNGKQDIDDLFQILDVSTTLPSTDFKSVKANNQKYKMLFENEQLVKKIDGLRIQSHIPQSEIDFLSFYFNPDPEKSLRYFRESEQLLTALTNQKQSPETAEYAKKLLSELLRVQRIELKAAEHTKSEIEKAINLQALVTLEYSLEYQIMKLRNVDTKECIGYRKNFYGLHHQLTPLMPDWMNNKFFKMIGVYSLYQEYLDKQTNTVNKKRFYKDYIINQVPGEIINDIDRYLQTLFDKTVLKSLQKYSDLNLKVFLSYDGNTLQISVLDIYTNEYYSDNEIKEAMLWKYVNIADNEELSKKQLSDLTVDILNHARNEKFRQGIWHSLRNKLLNKRLLAELFPVEANETNVKYRFSNVSHLYGLPEVADSFNQARALRKDLTIFFTDLKNCSQNIVALKTFAKMNHLPLTMPDVVEENIVSFSNIYPVHLLERTDINGKRITSTSLEAIQNLPALVGQIIGLTGQNAGGKTVCHETLAYTVYMAQAGLPVFGTDFVFSPKELIGSLYLERGEGSTMQLQIRKTKEILEAIDKVAPVNALIFLDEVGTGTAHDAGVAYGKKVLDAVYERKISCIFTTQLYEVAEYAEQNLSAHNYQLLENHKIIPGIGKPNIDSLLKQEGLDKFLK